MWRALRTFSPTQHSSLPGWMMPAWTGDTGYPTADHVVDYLTRYEERYQLAVRCGVRVSSIERSPNGLLQVHTEEGDWLAQDIVSATGTWSRPFIPTYPGHFAGRELHTAQYRAASDFTGQKVMIVGGGNSAAQILAEVPTVGELAKPAVLIPVVSAGLATSSWSTVFVMPANATSCTPASSSTASPTPAPDGLTEATRTSTPSSGAPAFARP